ncbi:hypothetical protein [Truepera radiovictrix]|uniref:Prevent-host-death family protein n=1 Tax=Truepera radiovictrix (strain DSM 17093 / CIP 108686 / LMG 22925 / RQ-24) TaxID=649638 RepID=D7CUH6_TRURR|nr:hypothetical protein [Truepera radiovictrix]ADI15761.1 conserved hypothetical protein [Truepera radiovictrix DSM 17093]WMT58612.1 hypothetical protein RCV51_06615 [Truepera radiovictrix]
MLDLNEVAAFVYDARGHKTHVLLPIEQYEKLLEALEDEGLVRALRETAGDDLLGPEQARLALEDE